MNPAQLRKCHLSRNLSVPICWSEWWLNRLIVTCLRHSQSAMVCHPRLANITVDKLDDNVKKWLNAQALARTSWLFAAKLTNQYPQWFSVIFPQIYPLKYSERLFPVRSLPNHVDWCRQRYRCCGWWLPGLLRREPGWRADCYPQRLWRRLCFEIHPPQNLLEKTQIRKKHLY